MKIWLKKVGEVAFETTDKLGNVISVEGPESMGGQGKGFRPMQVFLTSLGSCAAMDVVHILKKSRQTIEFLNIEISGERADAIPAVFREIHVCFIGRGSFTAEQLERAVQLSVEKYCSVSAMLKDEIHLRFSSVTKID